MRWGRISVKGKIFFCLAVFSVCILLILWLLQTVFLDEFYQMIKENEVRGYSQAIVDNIDDPQLDELLSRITESGDICVHIIDPYGAELRENGRFRYCSLQGMDEPARAVLFQKVKDHGGAKMLYFDGPQEGLPPGPYVPEPAAKKHPWMEKPLFSDGGIQQSLSYFQLAACLDGREVMVNINARITPLNATVGTLQIQIFCIGTLFFVLAGLLALWMARFIAKPIEDISRSSKELSRGNYEVYFDGRGYREIAELSDTLNGTAKALRQVERLRQELVANVSHDLRTPLTMIIGYGEAMRDIPGENTAENIQIIIDEAQRLSLLVNDILDISQIEAGMRRMEKGPLNLTQSIRETLSRYQKLVEQQGYAIEFEAGEAAWVLADRVKLDQVIYNLTGNALRFTGAEKRVTVRQQTTASEVRVDVIDYGDGIRPEGIYSIWKRYYSKTPARESGSMGTGLGLSIVEEILRLHGAAFGVDSQPGKGSDFWFILPLEKTQALPIHEKYDKMKNKGKKGGR